MEFMATPSVNYTDLVYPDVGDDNNTASAQVSGGSVAISTAFESHDHSLGKGAQVPVAGLGINATLDMRQDRDQGGGFGPSQGIGEAAFIQFSPVFAANVPNRSIFLDTLDDRLKWKDDTGTVKVFDTTPVQ